jgi:predicted kinase
VLAIGLPGSGKSTYFARQRITPLSSDLLRKVLWGDETDQRLPHLVFSALRYLLRLRLLAGARVTYVDATNITRRDRSHFFRIAENFGCVVDAVYFDTPREQCLQRNLRRPRCVPEAAVRRMAEHLQPPTLAEGFRRIFVVRPRVAEARGGKHGDDVS